jgi:holo-ACP synthase CitX
MNGELKQLQILTARERRVERIEELLKYDQVIVSLRVNYPGVEKDNPCSRKIVEKINQYLLKEFGVQEGIALNEGEGPVLIYLWDRMDGLKVKEAMVQIEENHPLGRLVDLDVYDKKSIGLSRQDLNLAPRKCFLCNEFAFICIRNQTHDVNHILDYIKQVVEAYEA